MLSRMLHLSRSLSTTLSFQEKSAFLSGILVEKVLGSPLIWERRNQHRFTADLGDGVRATLYPKSDLIDTVIYVSKQGYGTISHEPRKDWLPNWSVKEQPESISKNGLNPRF